MMPIRYIDMIRERYSRLGYPVYQWYRAEEPPAWTPLKKPLGESRVGVLCTAGTYVKGQVAYYYKDDTSDPLDPEKYPGVGNSVLASDRAIPAGGA